MELESVDPAPAAPLATPVRPSLAAWLGQGARSLLLRRVRWEPLQTSPVFLALMIGLKLAALVALDRIAIESAATFYWRATLSGWAAFALIAWACYALRPHATERASDIVAPSAAHLLTMVMTQALLLSTTLGLAGALLNRAGVLDHAELWLAWLAWLLPVTWSTLAMLVLLVRHGDPHLSQRVQAVYALSAACALAFYFAPPEDYWFETQASAKRSESISFTQELVENQAPLMDAQLDALTPQRPGVADMYTITFAPYEGEEVFRRESRMVGDVMAARFDAAGRGVRMINHREHLADMPWATPLNMQRAIAGIAETMDPQEDVLFIHLTSHGASDGELATNFWPLDVEPVVPAELKKWLDDAGIRHRVISISACFAGAWIAPLANTDTLVMTASDADHTSYGCGKKSDLTFFGRAMYDEQLRTKTRSFAQAHAAARLVIDQREKEAGKSDGYSNPQISMGERIAPYLEQLRLRLEQKP